MVKDMRAHPDGRGLRFAIAVARFNELVTERLLKGATEALIAGGVAGEDIKVVQVPGALELPLACSWLCGQDRFDGVVALAAIIRGDTDHYDYVCSATIDGIVRVNLESSTPVTCGVLTCGELDQALVRSGGEAGNKGSDAALAALEMACLRRQLNDDTN